MIHYESCEHIWYKFQTFMLDMTEVTVKWRKLFVKTVALTLKLSLLFNFYYSGIKLGIHRLPYVEIIFCKYEWYSLFSFYFIAKTEGPVFIETACIYKNKIQKQTNPYTNKLKLAKLATLHRKTNRKGWNQQSSTTLINKKIQSLPNKVFWATKEVP